MTGGLLQLMAYGCQDIFLTGQPEITFFKVKYRRDSNFSMDVINGYDYKVNDCMREFVYSTRKYNNFVISRISWPYVKGNISFTECKYKELCNKYDNTDFLSSVNVKNIEFNVVKGNKDIRVKLDKQNKMSKQLREDKKKEIERSKRVEDSINSNNSSKKQSRNGCPRNHKKFFYGK
jgi:hypothetical protein